jgi:hypothetical protein
VRRTVISIDSEKRHDGRAAAAASAGATLDCGPTGKLALRGPACIIPILRGHLRDAVALFNLEDEMDSQEKRAIDPCERPSVSS